MWVLTLYVLATGVSVDYINTFNTSKECLTQREVVLNQILKDNPQVKRSDFDNDKFVLLCHKRA